LTLQDPIKLNSPFGFETPEDSPGFLLWQTTITWQRLIKKKLDAFGISHAQFVIMAVLLWFEEHQQDPTQITISRLTKLDKMSVSKSLKKLAAQGYISRNESQKDTRAKCVHLTAQGKKLVTRLVPIVEGIDESFFGNLHRDDQKMLIQILNKVMVKMKE
jgi:MarR family transcriptional regulator, organic hydroperoxide resistance regulator